MNRITINETNSTSNSNTLENSEVVYVPGFAWTGLQNDVSILSKYQVPVLCKSLTEFYAYFGTSPAQFKANQSHPVGITDVAKPSSQYMYSAGDTDPAYSYARELLSMGIPVVYERMNKSANYAITASAFTDVLPTSYVKGSLVTYNDTYFICINAELESTATTFPAPPTDGSQYNNYWTRYKGYGVFNKNSQYSKGSIVFSNEAIGTTTATNKYFIAVSDYNVTGSFDDIDTYDSTKSYEVGDVIHKGEAPNVEEVYVFSVTTETETGVTYYYLENGIYKPCAEGETYTTKYKKITLTTDCVSCTTAGTGESTAWAATLAPSDTSGMIYWDDAAAQTTFAVGNVIKLNATVQTSAKVKNTEPKYDYFVCTNSFTKAEADEDFYANHLQTGNVDAILNLNKSIYTSSTVLEEDAVYYVPSDSTYKKYVITRTTGAWEFYKEASDMEDEAIYDVTVEQMYTELVGLFGSEREDTLVLKDKGEFNLKYITTGGYPNFEITRNGLNLASAIAVFAKNRGDCIALIDHSDKSERALIGSTSVYGVASSGASGIDADAASYATIITPWATYRSTVSNVSTSSGFLAPGSFGYLSALANARNYYTSWLPIAGTIRGIISGLATPHIDKTLTNSIADSYQCSPTDNGISINAITYVNNYGYCIWGNRTLLNNVAGSLGFAVLFLNIRNLMCDIKKRVWYAAQKLLFEQNTTTLWVKFVNEVSSLLEDMQSADAIKAFQITQNTSSDKTKVSATIKVWVIYAVESFDITIELTDDEIEIS